jgi:vancomycin permeability regulator SanA
MEWDEDSFDTESATVGGWCIEMLGHFPPRASSSTRNLTSPWTKDGSGSASRPGEAITHRRSIHEKNPILRFLRRLGRWAISLALLLALTVLGVNLYVTRAAARYILTPEAAAERTDFACALILGCAVLADGRPSAMLADRLGTGAALYASGTVPKLILSGDHGVQYYNEVGVMHRWCLEAGISPEDLFLDHAGFSTYESVYRARDIFECRCPLIVTQRYHLYRAVWAARALGMDAWGVAAPGDDYFGQLHRDIREIAARVKDFFFVLLDVPPTFLGDAIPISGSGLATLD